MFDRELILEAVKSNNRTRYYNNEITSEQMQTLMARYGQVMKKFKERERYLEKRKQQLNRISRHFSLIHEGLSNDKVFVAIDCEFDLDTLILKEVGFAIYQGFNLVTTKNIVIDTFSEKRHENIIISNSMVMQTIAAQQIIQQIYDEVDYAVFHSPLNDIKVLNLVTHKTRYFDTCFLASSWYINSPSLRALADRYDIVHEHPHVACFDAKTTMEVLIKQVYDKTPPFLFKEHWSMNEKNFIHKDLRMTDLDLFFQGHKKEDMTFEFISGDELMAHVMVRIGHFKSVSEARKNGWNKPIPAGFSQFKIGKQKRLITILNMFEE